MPVVALAVFAVAHAVLFTLYLPHRYTYPLLAFFAIFVAVALRPTWTALLSARRWSSVWAWFMLAAPVALALFAIFAFPIGPHDSPDRFARVTLVATVVGTAVLAGL